MFKLETAPPIGRENTDHAGHMDEQQAGPGPAHAMAPRSPNSQHPVCPQRHANSIGPCRQMMGTAAITRSQSCADSSLCPGTANWIAERMRRLYTAFRVIGNACRRDLRTLPSCRRHRQSSACSAGTMNKNWGSNAFRVVCRGDDPLEGSLTGANREDTERLNQRLSAWRFF